MTYSILGFDVSNGDLGVAVKSKFPGVGSLVLSAVLRRDYPVIQGALLVIAALYVLINFLIDFLYTIVDPRIRRARATA